MFESIDDDHHNNGRNDVEHVRSCDHLKMEGCRLFWEWRASDIVMSLISSKHTDGDWWSAVFGTVLVNRTSGHTQGYVSM